MSTIAIGDIHGNLTALTDLLGQIRGEVRRADTIVFLGDYMDRGPDTRGCVDAILKLQRECDADVVCLLGNHEEWFLRTLHDHGHHSWLLGMEAFDTIRSYSETAARTLHEAVSNAGLDLFLGRCRLPYSVFFDSVPPDHLRFFETLRPYLRTVDCVATHGGLDPLIPRMEDQPVQALVWGPGGAPYGYRGTDVLVYGHWNNPSFNAAGWPEPRIEGQTIGIDTIAHGVLTAIRLPDRRIFQSRRVGQECRTEQL
jgi:calcineurin-like phosphoesterase family protein